jgi:DNA excision repair protein ERCC-3
MSYVPENPLIVQGDRSILLETASPRFAEARDALLGFAELVKSPEYVHTWRLTALSLWNAASAGHTAEDVVETLRALAKFPVPDIVPDFVHDKMGRYGALRLVRDGEWLVLEGRDAAALEDVRGIKGVHDLLGEPDATGAVRVHTRRRGELKQALTAFGHPVEDLAGYEDGEALTMALAPTLPGGERWSMRDYQIDAVDAFHGGPGAGSGVIVLPCGAGKTVVGVAAMVRLGMRTLILCTGHTALQQWKAEILRRTTLTEDDVGEYSSDRKELRPVTLTTYQLLTWRRDQHSAPAHMGLFHQGRWGLIVYDEVHLLPAPVFREVAGVQARRRLGLTATLVREDGMEGDVFALVGPKRFDLPWKTLEAQGWIATARCVEVRVSLSREDRERYTRAGAREKFNLSATSARKVAVVEDILTRHPDAQILILGAFIDQLTWLAQRLRVPLVTGQTKRSDRDRIFGEFRAGSIRVLALSKVGNFAVDLPGASVAIQISGTWGSRQEEAQRLGRVLRAKEGDNQAVFYSLVSEDTREQELAERRQLFLAEQGYPYRIEHVS